MLLEKSLNSHTLEERKRVLKLRRKSIKGKPNYYLPTSYSSIKKSNPTEASSFIKNEDLVSNKAKVKKLIK